MNFEHFVVNFNDTILKSLQQIEKNKKGFLIVLDDDSKVVGTLTDGDIRRELLKNKNLNFKIKESYSKNFEYIYENDKFGKIIEIFKSVKIEFLPILNHENRLANIITKKNMHSLILEDVEFDMKYDFFSLDDSILEHEIYNRPWGIYKTTFLNPYSQSKIIKVSPLQQLSLQEHKKREEHWVVIKGVGEVVLGDSIKKISSGSVIYIPKGCKHRLTNTSSTKSLMVAEVQIGEYFGEDDIIRYDDKYNRN